MSTYLFVHGAWHGSWCWERVRSHLEARGHRTVAVDLPSDRAGAGRADYLAAINTALAAHSDMVLVAHSMSGLVAPEAANSPAVSALVLLAAMVPRPATAWAEHGVTPYAVTLRERADRLKFDEHARSRWEPDDAVDLFYQDCTKDDAEDAVVRLRADSSVVYGEPCPAEQPRQVPATYLSCLQDRALDGAWNGAVAAEVYGARLHQFDAGHSPFWSAPQALAALLEQLA